MPGKHSANRATATVQSGSAVHVLMRLWCTKVQVTGHRTITWFAQNTLLADMRNQAILTFFLAGACRNDALQERSPALGQTLVLFDESDRLCEGQPETGWSGSFTLQLSWLCFPVTE